MSEYTGLLEFVEHQRLRVAELEAENELLRGHKDALIKRVVKARDDARAMKTRRCEGCAYDMVCGSSLEIATGETVPITVCSRWTRRETP